MANNQESRLFSLLDKSRDARYYSYSLESILTEMKITRAQLMKVGQGLEEHLGKDYHVNVFDWTDDDSGKKFTFVGFAYRKRDYDRDKRMGVNVVERNIENGLYSTKFLPPTI